MNQTKDIDDGKGLLGDLAGSSMARKVFEDKLKSKREKMYQNKFGKDEDIEDGGM